MPEPKVQTRDNDGQLLYFSTIAEAMEEARKNPSIWKISWTDTETQERIRLVRESWTQKGTGQKAIFWVYEPLELSD